MVLSMISFHSLRIDGRRQQDWSRKLVSATKHALNQMKISI